MRPRAVAQDRSSWLALLLALNGSPGEQHALVGTRSFGPAVASIWPDRWNDAATPEQRSSAGAGSERFRRSRHGNAAAGRVEDCRGAPGSRPTWRGVAAGSHIRAEAGERSECLNPSPGTRIATAPAPTHSILTTPGHSSPEHRPAWTHSDPSPGILPRSAPGWPERSDQKREAREFSHSIQAPIPRPLCQICWLASNLMTGVDSVAGGGVRAREWITPACAVS